MLITPAVTWIEHSIVMRGPKQINFSLEISCAYNVDPSLNQKRAHVGSIIMITNNVNATQ